MTVTLEQSEQPELRAGRVRKRQRSSSLRAHGEPGIWLAGGSLAIALIMIAGLLGLVVYQGGTTFWPRPVVELQLSDGSSLMGEVTQDQSYVPEPVLLASMPDAEAVTLRAELEASGAIRRRLVRTGNFDLTGSHYDWVAEPFVTAETEPEWALIVERTSDGRFYGEPTAFEVDGEVLATEPAAIWSLFQEHHPVVLQRKLAAEHLEDGDLGDVNRKMEEARLDLRVVELEHGLDSVEWAGAKEVYEGVMSSATPEFERLTREIETLRGVNRNYRIQFRTTDGSRPHLGVADIVRAIPVNQLGFAEKLGVYGERWKEYLTADPREANSEGGVFPAIFGTVVMTLIMSILVVPFGVLAALYLHEYAKQGYLVSLVRIAVNNLAGVPSIVFGVFGLGFFCYIIGTTVDELLFSAKLPNPTYGKGGILWASLTLALLTLPVVIVATEEALAAVPGSMREGSFACGATKWQTIQRIVLPRAQPGIMTGMILAIARGAGEVAPLMLVGAVKLAPELPTSPERSFMHLGFHIFDVGFQSQNSEAAKPMVYTTTLLLIGIVVMLNVAAILIRSRLRKRFQAAR